MEPKTLLHADYLDIVFDNRNKNYGGYELRKHYDQRLGKAGALMALSVGTLVCFSFINWNSSIVTHPSWTPVTPTFIDNTLPKVLPKVTHITPPPPPPQKLKVRIFTDPIVDRTDNVPDDKTMTQNKNLTDARPGIMAADGDSTGLGTVPESGSGKGTIIEATKSDKPLVWVEQMPQFQGDMNAFIAGLIRYPAAASEAGIEGRVCIQFVVNEDGSVSNATVVRGIGGGCDEEALRIVNAMPKWKPGKQNGSPVKVFFTLPIKFMLK